MDRRVQTDRVDFAELFLMMDFGPAKPNQTAVVFEEANAVGFDARLRQLVSEGLGAEISLIGVSGKRRIVDEAESLVVLARYEGPCGERFDHHGEGTPHLMQRPNLAQAIRLGDRNMPRHRRLAPHLENRSFSERVGAHAIEHRAQYSFGFLVMVVGDERFEVKRVVDSDAPEVANRVAAAGRDDTGEAAWRRVKRFDPAVIEAIVAEIERQRVVEQMARRLHCHRVVSGHVHNLHHRWSLWLLAGCLLRRRATLRPMARPRTPKGRAQRTHELLKGEYPEAICELDHENSFQLLIATILSAQATDVGVNKATPGLFARFPDAESLAEAELSEVESLIGTLGLFRNKAKSITKCAQQLMDHHDGEVPTSYKDLTALGGVGRKTANVVRSVALDLPGLPVDTHVLRLSNLLGITTLTDPVKVEMELNPMVPAAERGEFSLRLILHGRRVCIARRPRCEDCVLASFCPSSTVPG